MGDGSFRGINRRDLLKLGAVAPAAASAAAIVTSPYGALAGSEGADASRPDTRFIVDVHAHVGAPAGFAAMAPTINSPADWAAFRSKEPELFAKLMSGDQIDNSDALIETMDKNGVTHALIQVAPHRNARNKLVADAARRHRGRLFPLYRPEFAVTAAASGTLDNKDPAVLSRNARRIAEDIESLFPELGMIGVGEVIPGGMVSAASDPVEIARDMSPIMEALRPGNLPIQLPTGWSGWKDTLHYTWSPIYVDVLAGNFPDVPIVLVKMGRGFRVSFDTCVVVAMRNVNVYLDMTDAPSEHIREAVQILGAERIMFGTDLSLISHNYSYKENFHALDGAQLNAEELEWIAWRTANKVYRLGLEA